MVAWILKKILGSKNQRELRRLTPTVRRINEFDEQFKSLSDDELQAKTEGWKEEISKISDMQEQWRKLEEILPEAFAVVKNAARRLSQPLGVHCVRPRHDRAMGGTRPDRWRRER